MIMLQSVPKYIILLLASAATSPLVGAADLTFTNDLDGWVREASSDGVSFVTPEDDPIVADQFYAMSGQARLSSDYTDNNRFLVVLSRSITIPATPSPSLGFEFDWNPTDPAGDDVSATLEKSDGQVIDLFADLSYVDIATGGYVERDVSALAGETVTVNFSLIDNDLTVNVADHLLLGHVQLNPDSSSAPVPIPLPYISMVLLALALLTVGTLIKISRIVG